MTNPIRSPAGDRRPDPAGLDGLSATLMALICLVLTAGPTAGQEWLQMTTARQVSGEEKLSLDLEYGAGDLTVTSTGEDLLYRASLRYDASSFRPIRSYRLTDGTARVELGLESENGDVDLDVDWSELDLQDLDLGDMEVEGGKAGEMELVLGRSVSTELELRTGATRSEIRLGGVPLTSLRIFTGASQTTLDFDEPNPVRMSRLHLKAGAAELEARKLGNARASEIVVESAVGEVDLDFSGEWTRDVTARVKTGIGQVVLRIPRDLGVRVEKTSLLSSFSGIGLEKTEGGTYRTDNWSEADHHLDLSVEAAFGSIRVVRAR